MDGGVMIVRADRLGETPLGFQAWVEDYFVKTDLLGLDCWMAKLFTYPPSSDGWRRGSGIAPCHNTDLNHYVQEWGEPHINTWKLLIGSDNGIFMSIY
jgi:hypothetical protein